MNKRLKLIIATWVGTLGFAYGQGQAEMADAFRADGKIYVVVAIVLIVLAGLIFYLFLMDKKVKKLEKLVSDRKKQTN